MNATPRPFYRWKSFWLGVLVMGFLGWAWARSMHRNDSVSFGLGMETWEIVRSHGKTSAICFNETWTGRSFHSVWFSSVPGEGLNQDIPPAFERVAEERVAEFEWTPAQWMVADWFLILLFLIPWSAWLFWHWKREQKILTT